MGRSDGQPDYFGRVNANGTLDEEQSGPGWESTKLSAGTYKVTVPLVDLDGDGVADEIDLENDYRRVRLEVDPPEPAQDGWAIDGTRNDNVMTVTVKHGQAKADHAFKFDLQRLPPGPQAKKKPAGAKKKPAGAKKKAALKAGKKKPKKKGGY